MAIKDILNGKKILVVDDELDMLDTVREQLEDCDVTTANSFEDGKAYLEKDHFDLAILDIMGVWGFDLLRIANENKVPSIMLTAYVNNMENIKKAVDRGAVSFLPKDDINKMEELIAEIFGELDKGRTHWPKLKERWGDRFKRQWGEAWQKIKFPKELK
jgi:DNA-binding response OmpR family regulator